MNQNHSKKTLRGQENDHIEGYFNVPDVFMKIKYGSTAQYNYEIGEQEEFQLSENLTQKPEEGRRSKEFTVTVLFW